MPIPGSRESLMWRGFGRGRYRFHSLAVQFPVTHLFTMTTPSPGCGEAFQGGANAEGSGRFPGRVLAASLMSAQPQTLIRKTNASDVHLPHWYTYRFRLLMILSSEVTISECWYIPTCFGNHLAHTAISGFRTNRNRKTAGQTA